MSSIFISHSSKDNQIAQEVKKRLEEQGHRSVFLDFDPTDGIPAGRNWEREIYTRLRECSAIIVLCSQHSMSSSWCFAEITMAKSLGKRIFPVKIEPCTIEKLLEDVQLIDMTRAGEAEAYERLWEGFNAVGLNPKDLFDWDGSRPPYPGLMAFEEEDAAIFFGRDDDIREGLGLLNRLRTFSGSRFIQVLGASGSGKSSLVRAGLLPRLKRDEQSWLVVDPFRPLRNPLSEFAKAVAQCFLRYGVLRSWTDIRDVLLQIVDTAKPDVGGLFELGEELRTASGKSNATILIVVDQFEELLGSSSDDQNVSFLLLLRAVLDSENSPFMVIGTLRSDFLAAFQMNPAIKDVHFESLTVGSMGPEKIAQIIEGPARTAGLELEPGLVQLMVDDTKTDDALPLLAFTLRELWEGFSEDRSWRIDDYNKLGKLEGSIARAAEIVLDTDWHPGESVCPDGYKGPRERTLRVAFLKMVRIDDEGNYTRQTARWAELPKEVHELLEKFVDARLLMSSGDTQGRFLEVRHEALFRSWERLTGWLKENSEFLRWRESVDDACNAWEQSGRDNGALLRGVRLAEAEEWEDEYSEVLNGRQHEFLSLSLKLREREDQERKLQEKKNRILTEENRAAKLRIRIGAAILAPLLILAIIIGFRTKGALNRQKEVAAKLEREGVQVAESFRSGREISALLMAMQKGKELKTWVEDKHFPQEYPTISPLFALQLAVDNIRELNHFNEPRGQSIHIENEDVDCSPDEEHVAFLSGYGSISVWNHSGKLIGEFSDYKSEGLIFCSDAKHLATLSGTTFRIFTLTGEEVRNSGPQGPLGAFCFSPDREQVAIVGDAGKIKLWNFSTGKLRVVNTQHKSIQAIFFNENGKRAATVENGSITRLWDSSEQWELLAELKDSPERVDSVKVNSDGQYMLTLKRGSRSARLWKISERKFEQIKVFDEVRDAKFHPDGNHIATIELDQTIKIWRLSGQSETILAGHKPWGISFSETWEFSQDGKYVAAAGSDGTVRIWKPIEDLVIELKGYRSHVQHIHFSPDNHTVVTVNSNGMIRVWDISDRFLLTDQHVFALTQTSLSPDGKHVATYKDALRIWKLSELTAKPLFMLQEDNRFEHAIFSPDGQKLAITAQDGTIQILSLSGKQFSQPWKAHKLFLGTPCVNFSLNGQWIVTAGIDDETQLVRDPVIGKVKIWDLSGKMLSEFAVEGVIERVYLNAEDRRVVSLKIDGSAQLGDSSGKRLAQFSGRQGVVRSIDVSSDWKRIVIGDESGVVNICNPSGESVTLFYHRT